MRKTIVLYALLVMVLGSCARKEQCPAFDNSVLAAWFPYQQGETYYFADMNGKTDTMIITGVDGTQAGTIENPWAGKANYCEVNGSVVADTRFNPTLVPMQVKHIVATMGSDVNMLRMYIQNARFIDVQLTGNEPGKLIKDAAEQYTQEAIPSLDVNGKIYNDVIAYTLINTALLPGDVVNKVFIARGHGFIGYRKIAGNMQYWLQ